MQYCIKPQEGEAPLILFSAAEYESRFRWQAERETHYKNDLHALLSRLWENLQHGSKKDILDKLHAGAPVNRDTNQNNPEPVCFYNSYKPQRLPVIRSTDCNLLYKYAKFLHACLVSA